MSSYCWPSAETIVDACGGEEAGWYVQRLSRYRDELKRFGLVDWYKRHRHSTVYWINPIWGAKRLPQPLWVTDPHSWRTDLLLKIRFGEQHCDPEEEWVRRRIQEKMTSPFPATAFSGVETFEILCAEACDWLGYPKGRWPNEIRSIASDLEDQNLTVEWLRRHVEASKANAKLKTVKSRRSFFHAGLKRPYVYENVSPVNYVDSSVIDDNVARQQYERFQQMRDQAVAKDEALEALAEMKKQLGIDADVSGTEDPVDDILEDKLRDDGGSSADAEGAV